ncbi:hypothetical protein CHCC20375_3963 [Bacillus licheniformis]|nr:hypothetical protein CHCC20375_3963 [Bacillus licheniformis]
MTPPIAAAAATDEPEMEPNNMFPTTFVWAREPGSLPLINFAKLMSRIAIPPLFIIMPDKMKNGTANKEKLSIPVTIFCAEVKMATSKGKMVSIVTMDAAAILTEIGTPRNNNMKNTADKMRPAAMAISFHLFFSF